MHHLRTQVAGGKSTVWQYTQDWINAIYGSPEAAAAAGYVPSTVRAGGSLMFLPPADAVAHQGPGSGLVSNGGEPLRLNQVQWLSRLHTPTPRY